MEEEEEEKRIEGEAEGDEDHSDVRKLWLHGLVACREALLSVWSQCVRESQPGIQNHELYAMCVGVGGVGLEGWRVGQKDLFRFRHRKANSRGEAGEIFLPVMHGSDSVPAWTYPQAYGGFVCVCACVRRFRSHPSWGSSVIV